mmetsp:Transcript_3747/g.11114  ORF Transcript_3747/g.11114 Transcript_3747/m.11114 type:complete len:166 (+) Transcript_3747:8-505(+)
MADDGEAPSTFMQMLADESAREHLTIDRVNMLKAQVFQLERANGMLTDTLSHQHDNLSVMKASLTSLNDLVTSVDLAGHERGADVSIPWDTWQQLVVFVSRLHERSSKPGSVNAVAAADRPRKSPSMGLSARQGAASTAGVGQRNSREHTKGSNVRPASARAPRP